MRWILAFAILSLSPWLLQPKRNLNFVGSARKQDGTSYLRHNHRRTRRLAYEDPQQARIPDAIRSTQEDKDNNRLPGLIQESSENWTRFSNFLQTVGLTLCLSVFLILGLPQIFKDTASKAMAETTQPTEIPSRTYVNVTGFPFPLGPFFERKTVETEIVKDKVYGFEQPQDLAGITANVRCTVFRTRDNHLVIYNPLAPTGEFLQQLKALNHKGVAHILLGSTAYEHKVYTPAFSREFPDAKVWAVPDQWSWPLDLPPQLLGLNATGELLDTADRAAYANAPDLTDEFEVKLLRPQQRLAFGYSAVEAAVFHKDTKVVCFTDALLNIPGSSTEVYDKAELLAVGDTRRDSNTVGNLVLKAAGAVNWRGTAATMNDKFWSQYEAKNVGANSENVQRGWELNTLLSLYFGPSPSSLVDPHQSFEKLKDKWIVAPVTNAVIYSSDKVKPELKRWVDDVARWDFTTISPAHFEARPGTPGDLRAAFAPTLESEARDPNFDAADFNLLEDAKGVLKQFNVI